MAPMLRQAGWMRKKSAGQGHGFGLFTQLLSSRYALQSLAYLAQIGPARFVPVEELASKEGLPPSFLSKILRRLVEKGFLRVRRGPNGGYSLARAPGEITALDILDATTDPRQGRVCLLGARPCASISPCKIHETAAHAERSLRKRFARLTLTALADERQ